MRHSFSFKRLLLLSTLFIFTFGCKNKSKTADAGANYWEYRNQVSSFTNGTISKTSEIRVFLAEEITKIEEGEKIPSSVFKISPSVKGTIYLDGKSGIVFDPEENLKEDQEYTVMLALNKLIDVPKNLKTFEFKFSTIKQDFSVLVDAIQSSSTTKNEQFIVGHVSTADAMELADVQKLISAKQDKKDLNIEWDEANTETNFGFKITGIQRTDESSEVLLNWNGKSKGIKNNGNEKVYIPGKNDFKIIRSMVIQVPEQYVQLNFSDQLDKTQNFKGLVGIDSLNTDLRYTVDGNLLKIYPENRMGGDRKVIVSTGVKSSDGVKLKSKYTATLTFETAKPELRMVNSGSILPNGNAGLKFNFEATGLKAVDVRVIKVYEKNVLQFLQVNNYDGSSQLRRVGRPIAKQTLPLSNTSESGWKAYAVDLSKLITTEPGAIYRVELSFKKPYSLYACEEAEDDEIEPVIYRYEEYDEGDENNYWDSDEYYYDSYYDNGYYNWRERDNPCSQAYYSRSRSLSANIFSSDLGMIAKQGKNGKTLFVVNNILSTAPESGAKVIVYNYQQDEVAELTTDEKGMATYEGEAHAYFAMATKKGQNTYISMRDGSALAMSQFRVGGSELQKGLKGYIYGERGIWRPGDSLFLNFILNDNDNPLPENHPVKFELTDPAGKLADRQVSTTGQNGFYTFKTSTASEAKTGNWQAKFMVGGAQFFKSIPIETIKPNRLKINLGVEDAQGNLEVKWLHGAKARNMKAVVDATVRSTNTVFDRYEGYEFDDPAREYEAGDIRVFDGSLDNEGRAAFKTELDVEDNAPGKLRVTYLTKVFENGGGFSVDAYSDDYSPYSTYVGVKQPEAKNYFRQLDTDKEHTFNIVTVDENGKPRANREVELEVYKVDWRWWWSTSNENLSSYVSGSSKTAEYTAKVTTNSKGEGDFKVRINYPEWGRYLVRVKDVKGGHAAGTTVYIDWPDWRGRSAKEGSDGATILAFTADKEEYNVGDDMEVNFPSAKGGRALVTLETGAQVIDAFWVDPKEDYTKLKIKARPEMAPNVYINITYLQSHGVSENDLPIRMYGVIPVTITDPKTKLNPEIQMASTLEPESDYKVTVKEGSGKAMTYTLAVVDEGLLDLTRFQTPNAWSDFFKKQALGVRSWDVYDDIIGAYGGRIDQVFTIGGGDAVEAAGAQKANRFKPVVKFIGPFTLKANGKKTHKLEMPNYVGSVRVMVVAGNKKNNAYGKADLAVPVKKPLMILGSLPRKVSQTETVKLPVAVFAMDKKVKNVKVEVKPNNLLRVNGNTTQTLNFTETGEQEVEFELDASETMGIAKVDIVATGGGETATYSVELDVINPNPPITEFKDYELKPGESLNVDFSSFGMQGTNAASLEFSNIPNVDFNRRLDFLIRYPHGCVEQTTSAAFPQMYLAQISDITDKQKTDIRQNITDAIYRLKGFQASNGGFSYWPGGSSADDWGSSYAGHFILEAKNKGYDIPVGMISNWKQYQSRAARSWSPSTRWNNHLTQAYRLYTLALAGDPDLAAMNRLREQTNLSNNAKWRLAAAYALAGQKNSAEKLVASANRDFNPNDRYYSYGSDLRNKSMALETAVITEDDAVKKELSKELGRSLSSKSWYSTQSTAYALIALGKMIEKQGGKGFQLSYATNGNAAQSLNSNSSLALRDLSVNMGSNTVQLKNQKENTVYVRLLQTGIPPLGTERPASNNLSATIRYLDLEGNPISINALEQATDFAAEITVRNLTNKYVDNIALTQVLPSGWEIVNTRYTEIGDQQPSRADYIDIRDDRVNYYFPLNRSSSSGSTKTFRLLLNASYEGRYYLPAPQAEAMYDNEYRSRGEGKWVTVMQPE